jgi:sporulation protein YlmC with PRC-barrel domain
MNWTPSEAEHLVGSTLTDSGGRTVGTVDDVYVDPASSRPHWLLVNTGVFGDFLSIVPAGEARVEESVVTVPYTMDQVTGAPNARRDRDVAQHRESMLYFHYRLDAPEFVVGPVDHGSTGDELKPPSQLCRLSSEACLTALRAA